MAATEYDHLYDLCEDGVIPSFTTKFGILRFDVSKYEDGLVYHEGGKPCTLEMIGVSVANAERGLFIRFVKSNLMHPLDYTPPKTPIYVEPDMTSFSCLTTLYKAVFKNETCRHEMLEQLRCLVDEDFSGCVCTYPFEPECRQLENWIPLVAMSKAMQTLLVSWFNSIGLPCDSIQEYIDHYSKVPLQKETPHVHRFILNDVQTWYSVDPHVNPATFMPSYNGYSDRLPMYTFQTVCRKVYGLLPGSSVPINLDMERLYNTIREELVGKKYIQVYEAIQHFSGLISKYNFKERTVNVILMHGALLDILSKYAPSSYITCAEYLDVISKVN